MTQGDSPLQPTAHSLRALATCALVLVALVFPAGNASAQSAQAVPDDYYRAEFVIFERIVGPETLDERMAGREIAPTTPPGDTLWAVSEQGEVTTTLNLAPEQDLYLKTAAQRLERSGRYRVLMTAGWYQSFPPDYEGPPLRVALGDWIAGAGQREIEGTLTIRRQRYLHVSAELNHWRAAPVSTPMPVAGPEETPMATGEDPMLPGEQAAPARTPLELVTWIRETRRMRSEEIHLLDSPTIGVLVFFKRVGAED